MTTAAPHIVITGGGTGGHLFPGIAIARAFQQRMADTAILFVGTGRELEKRVLGQAGYRHVVIRVGGLKGMGVFRQLRSLASLPGAVLRTGAILRHFRPAVVIGVGGCVASQEGDAIRERAPYVDLVFGPQTLHRLPQMLAALNRTAAVDPWSDCPLRFAAVGGGRVAAAELEEAHAHGIPAYEGYGLSECHSVVSLNTPGDSRPGSAGRPLSHARVRIAADGEILVSGAVMRGYLEEADEADEACGEIATGDLGRIDSDGFLHVQGRKKNLFITAFGRNVSPEWVESELLHEAPIAQVLVWGEALPRNGAVIVPAGPVSPDAVQAAIEAANRRLPDYARVGAWLFADAPFRPQAGELTANGRLRRDALLARYGSRLTNLIHGVTTPDKKVINA